MIRTHISTVLIVSSLCSFSARAAECYTDSPMQPNGKWHVHDPNRPKPPIITPGERFSQLANPPSDAVALFDGKDFSKWRGEKGDVKWKLQDDYMETTSTGKIRTKDEFGDFQMHLEFATPSKVEGNGQGRGNNGVNIYGLYEIQVLDSYKNETYADGQAGAIYGQTPPLVNASKPPGAWQTYDIVFHRPVFGADGSVVEPARVTVFHNGILVHDNDTITGWTVHHAVATYRSHPDRLPLLLQDHAHPVRYRNIWVRELAPKHSFSLSFFSFRRTRSLSS